MKNSHEYSVESFFLALFKADDRTRGKTIVHFDEDREAKSDCIVVEAKQGNHELAGFGGYAFEVQIEYRSDSSSKKRRNDLTASALHDVIYNNALSAGERANMARDAGMTDLLIKDESSSDRQNAENLRKRMLTLPVQAAFS